MQQMQPEVIVPPTQARALARFRELLRSGVLNDATLPAAEIATRAELVIPPLTIPQIAVPDAQTVTADETDARTTKE